MTREDAFELLRKIGDKTELHSRFLYPDQSAQERAYFPAIHVYNAIRESCSPPITEDEFNDFFERSKNT